MKSILVKPLYTEKMTQINPELGKYGFIVNIDANKIEIAEAIEKKFNVKVEEVNTIRYKGKEKTQFRRRGRYTGRTAKYKKAIVTLKKGDKIELFEQV
ncbi:MAG: 50S ribosomal protein L23 [Ignavibacteriales bacterium]|jgi:large subunit ribosomal protein L23|nr:50S ribosomal protein L23 [Ignavibacteriaceae bacterium]NLH62099.1 50S ribosomal protein L23 [Ignavibacteriales bacterium]HOJ17799.1 50S ribosomal protein L23 [Ignavibacteriaceae bacterium]HPO55054.1 50S ribosomal protein L23 [Ignavibacteriaceae bacterium]